MENMFNTEVLPHGIWDSLGIHRTAKLAWQKEKKKSSSSFTVEIQVKRLWGFILTLTWQPSGVKQRLLLTERAAKWHITMWAVCWIGSSRWQHRCFLFKFRGRSQVVLPTLSFSRLAYNKMQSLFSKSQLCILLVKSDKIYTPVKRSGWRWRMLYTAGTLIR